MPIWTWDKNHFYKWKCNWWVAWCVRCQVGAPAQVGCLGERW